MPGGTSDAPLRERVTAEIRDRILDGQLRPGDALAETALAELVGASRGPVRDALVILEREGLVTLRTNRRARVRTFDVRDAEEIYSLRRSLEELAARRAVANATPRDLDDLRSFIAGMKDAFEKGDMVQLSRLDVGFHDRIYLAARHERLYHAWSDLRSQVAMFLVSRNTTAHTNREIVIGEHQALVDALAERDADTLVAATDAHLFGAYERLRDKLIMAPRTA